MKNKSFITVNNALSKLTEREVTVFDTIPSTNTELMGLLRSGDTAPRILAAKKQSAGRGRRGRSFLSDEGGVYFSFNTSVPSYDAEFIGCVTPLAGVAAVSAIEKLYGIKPSLKWVNDLIYNGKKLGGILSESVVIGDSIHVVVGIGINILSSPLPDIATCLFESESDICDANELIASIVSEFGARMPTLSLIADEYRASLCHLGKKVRVHTFDGADDHDAVSLDVNEKCELIVLSPNGQKTALSSGEVSIKIN